MNMPGRKLIRLLIVFGSISTTGFGQEITRAREQIGSPRLSRQTIVECHSTIER